MTPRDLIAAFRCDVVNHALLPFLRKFGQVCAISFSPSYLICPVVWLTVGGAPLQNLQPASSAPGGSQLSEFPPNCKLSV